jgi:hypothetical protein
VSPSLRSSTPISRARDGPDTDCRAVAGGAVVTVLTSRPPWCSRRRSG